MMSPFRVLSLRLVVGLIVVATTLAGCVGDRGVADDPPAGGPPESPPTQTEREHQAERAPRAEPDTPATYTTEDWFLLSTPRDPDGHVRAFHFRVPPGGVGTVGQGSVPLFFLEIVPVNNDLGPGEDWALYGFRDRDGSAQVLFSLYGVTMVTEDLSQTPPQKEVGTPNAPGQVYIVTAEDLADGDDLYFVLVGHGDEDGEMALAMRIRQGEGREAPRPSPDFTAFAATESTPPVAPTPIHDRTGAFKAVFGEIIEPDGRQMRAATENVVYSHEPVGPEDASGATNARRLTVATDAPTGPGWTYAAVQHDAGGEVVAWSLEVAAQGTIGRASGVTAGVPVQAIEGVPDAATGRPGAFYLADGTGASHTRLELEGAEADFGVSTYVHHGWLSAPLEDIIGIPSDHFEGLDQGAAGGLPWMDDWPPTLPT